MNNIYRHDLKSRIGVLAGMTQMAMVREDKKAAARNLYLSGISEEFIGLQLDLETPVVVQTLKDQGVYKK